MRCIIALTIPHLGIKSSWRTWPVMGHTHFTQSLPFFFLLSVGSNLPIFSHNFTFACAASPLLTSTLVCMRLFFSVLADFPVDIEKIQGNRNGHDQYISFPVKRIWRKFPNMMLFKMFRFVFVQPRRMSDVSNLCGQLAGQLASAMANNV